jgi:hypothetical protein
MCSGISKSMSSNRASMVPLDRCWACPAGYGGPACDPICSPACANGGTCSSPGVCSCVGGWKGASCSQATCNPSCGNGGDCTAPNQCQCQNGWTGPACAERTCYPACQNQGAVDGVVPRASAERAAPCMQATAPRTSSACAQFRGAVRLVRPRSVSFHARYVFVDRPASRSSFSCMAERSNLQRSGHVHVSTWLDRNYLQRGNKQQRSRRQNGNLCCHR